MGSLPTWKEQRVASLPSHASMAKDCMALANLASDYREKETKSYEIAPEQISTMLLVIGEIWHVLDTLVVKILPLLSEFSPALIPDLFRPLLLPKRLQMQRLQEIELHIAARHGHAKLTSPEIFSDPAENSFAVQYYQNSESHKNLRTRIEKAATATERNKQDEWEQATTRYEKLKDEAKPKTCEIVTTEDGQDGHDSVTCAKCVLNREADSMVIDVYEWPLPDDNYSAASAAVELDCPVEFVAWRNVTWMLLQDFGRSGGSTGAYPAVVLSNYVGLMKYAKERQSRLTLASTVKPFGKAHYGQLKFPVTLDRCFVNNALHYKLFDPKRTSWISDQKDPQNLRAHCITVLPQGPYTNLQFAVDSVDHSVNQVIADKDTCSKSLSL